MTGKDRTLTALSIQKPDRVPLYIHGINEVPIAVTQDVVHPGLRAISLSLCVIVQHLFGSALGPPFIGSLSDRYSLETAMQFLPLFAFLAGILHFAGAFFYVNDAARVEQVEIVMED